MARNPYRKGGMASDLPELDDDPPKKDSPADPPEDDEDEDDQGDEDDEQDDEPAAADESTSAAGSGAGWILGLLLWGWVILPFVKGGPIGVANTLKAKFLNKAPDGSELP